MNAVKLAALSLAASVALFSTGASAAVVCNDEGDCWRTKHKHHYKPELRLRIYSDDWKWGDHDKNKYRWRQAHEGRGYWRKGVWITF